MAKLCINPSLGGNSDYYGTFINITNGFTGNVFRGLDVVQNGTPNLTVKVNPGSGLIREGSFPGEIGYHVAIDTSGGESVSLSGLPDASNPRNIYIIGYVKKATTPSGTNNTNVFDLVAVGGTPSGTPADPTVPQIQASAVGATNPYYVLGRVRLEAGATQATTAKIDDLRIPALPRTGAVTATVDTAETTTSTSFTDLATTTDTVTALIGTSGMAEVTITARFGQAGAFNFAYAGFAISGATTVSASDSFAAEFQAPAAGTFSTFSATFPVTGLTAGTNTFKMKYRVDGSTGTFAKRRITVKPL